jgi:antitoxin component YwqK of YwqJK toxin-antitoxin module
MIHSSTNNMEHRADFINLKPTSLLMKKLLLLLLMFLVGILVMFGQNPVNAMYAGEKDGKVVSNYGNGKVQTECTIVNGNIQGDRLSYYKDGKLQVKEHFEKGSYNGTCFFLKNTGDTISITVYAHDTLKFSKNFEYYKDGKLKSSSSVTYIPDPSTPFNSMFVARGTMDNFVVDLNVFEQTYNNHGVYREYYKSGGLKLMANTKKVFLEGKATEYYENGTKKVESNYSSGKLNGEYKEYYENYTKKIVGAYRDDKKDGEFKEYDEAGNVKTTVYQDGAHVK